jgi:hypothetical protein
MDVPHFQHFVLTRFNLRIPGRPPASESWLRTRLELMKRTMIPAMLSQTVKPDFWLVYCDARSPEWFRSELQTALAGVGTAVWIEDSFSPESASDVISSAVQKLVTAAWVITTRVDNDDCVSKYFIEQIQQAFDETETFVNFPYGIQYELGFVYHRLDMSNAFITHVERADKPVRTVFKDGHHLLKNHGKIRQIWTSPMWMQIVHESNIANKVRGVRSNPAKARDFATSLPINSAGNAKIAMLAAKDGIGLGLHVASRIKTISKLGKMMLGRPE